MSELSGSVTVALMTTEVSSVEAPVDMAVVPSLRYWARLLGLFGVSVMKLSPAANEYPLSWL